MEAPNPRPNQPSNLPAITLAVLVALILALLYVGYEYIADTSADAKEFSNIVIDSTNRQGKITTEEPVLINPEEAPDTAGQPVPVDLSQSTPATDEPVATADAIAEDNRENMTEGPATEKPVTEKTASEKPVTEKPVAEKPTSEKPAATTEKPATPKTGGVSSVYTVGSGETFYGVANRYNLKVSTLKALNPGVSENSVKAGITKLTVKVRAVHTVGPGDVLRVVAEKYGISKEALMRANGKTKDLATRGEKLNIPFAEKQ
jgi:LysM repeat protein